MTAALNVTLERMAMQHRLAELRDLANKAKAAETTLEAQMAASCLVAMALSDWRALLPARDCETCGLMGGHDAGCPERESAPDAMDCGGDL